MNDMIIRTVFTKCISCLNNKSKYIHSLVHIEYCGGHCVKAFKNDFALLAIVEIL